MTGIKGDIYLEDGKWVMTGGLLAAATTKELHGDDFYKRIGRKGGKAGHTGGFAADPDLARKAGSIGGYRSIRGWKVIKKKGMLYTYRNNLTGAIKEIDYGND